MITNLFDSSREKRRVVRFDDLPPVMVHAVLAAEDKRFFDHGALDLVRVFGAAFYDVTRGQKAQGASTIDMQVARTFFFTTKREWSRKVKEILMAAEIDERFSKQQIFELYANDIYLGNRGSFSIRGFGEAAQAYFGKDVRELSAGEAAFLAGIIRAPNRYSSAERHMDRAEEARDRVLAQMVEDGYITAEQEVAAKKAKLKFVNGGVSSSSAPYFVDMVKDHLLETSLRERSRKRRAIASTPRSIPIFSAPPTEAVQIGMQGRGQASRPAATRSGRRKASPFRRRKWRWWRWIRTPAKSARSSAAAITARASSTTPWRAASPARSSSRSFTRRHSTMPSRACSRWSRR